MTTNVSAFGFVGNLVASVTYPQGITLTSWADDNDPADISNLAIADKGMNINGTQVVWAKPNSIIVAVSLIIGTPDQLDMAALYEANRVGFGKTSARDILTLTFVYPDGTRDTFTQGILETGAPARSISSQGRMKTITYSMAFENMSTS